MSGWPGMLLGVLGTLFVMNVDRNKQANIEYALDRQWSPITANVTLEYKSRILLQNLAAMVHSARTQGVFWALLTGFCVVIGEDEGKGQIWMDQPSLLKRN